MVLPSSVLGTSLQEVRAALPLAGESGSVFIVSNLVFYAERTGPKELQLFFPKFGLLTGRYYIEGP